MVGRQSIVWSVVLVVLVAASQLLAAIEVRYSWD